MLRHLNPLVCFVGIICLSLVVVILVNFSWSSAIDLTLYAVEVNENGQIIDEGQIALNGEVVHYLFKDDQLQYHSFQILDLSFYNSNLLKISSDHKAPYYDKAHEFYGKYISVVYDNLDVDYVAIQTLRLVLSSQHDCGIFFFRDGDTQRKFYVSINKNIDPQAIEMALNTDGIHRTGEIKFSQDE